MNNAVINIKTEPKMKAQAQKIADEMGLSLTAVINRYLKQFIETKTITFQIHEETPNAYLKGIMKRAEKDLQTGNTSPKFAKTKDFIAYLHKQTGE